MPCLAETCAADLKSSEASPQLVPGSSTQDDKMKSSPVLFIGYSWGLEQKALSSQWSWAESEEETQGPTLLPYPLC